MNYFKKFISITLAVAILVLGVYFLSNDVESGSLDNIEGYAWGADDTGGILGGLGWLSFNNCEAGNCSDQDYGVDFDDVTGDLSGYAWSSNFGWLQFGGLSGFPSGSGTLSENALVDVDPGSSNYGEVTGWARFNAGTGAETGGWDGWLSLRGDISGGGSYGVSIDLGGTNEFSGYAWGGSNDYLGNSDVGGVGWVDFNPLFGGVEYVPYTAPPGITLIAEPSEALPANGYLVDLEWNFTPPDLPVPPPPTDCIATTTSSDTGWTGSVDDPGPPGDATVQTGVYVPDNPTTFTITCDYDGGTVTDDAIVPRTPQDDWVRFWQWSQPSDDDGDGIYTSELFWDSWNADDGTCEASDDGNIDTNWGFKGDPQLVLVWDSDPDNDGADNGNSVVNVESMLDETTCTTYTITCNSDIPDNPQLTDSVCLNQFTAPGNIRPEFREE